MGYKKNWLGGVLFTATLRHDEAQGASNTIQRAMHSKFTAEAQHFLKVKKIMKE